MVGRWLRSIALAGLTVGASSCTLDDQRQTTSMVQGKVDRGAEVYAEYCVRCHGQDGSGNTVGLPVPDIRGRDLWSKTSDTLLTIVAFGMVTHYSGDSVVRTMPPAPYGDADLAAVASYVSKHIGNVDRAFTADDVARVRGAYKEALRERLRASTRPTSQQIAD